MPYVSRGNCWPGLGEGPHVLHVAARYSDRPWRTPRAGCPPGHQPPGATTPGFLATRGRLARGSVALGVSARWRRPTSPPWCHLRCKQVVCRCGSRATGIRSLYAHRGERCGGCVGVVACARDVCRVPCATCKSLFVVTRRRGATGLLVGGLARTLGSARASRTRCPRRSPEPISRRSPPAAWQRPQPAPRRRTPRP